ncbi:hypothetical protein [Sphingomonas sp.]|uniref:hypothetical protein n=1 Tax=Sphingomonas sp. TaxID=28214 RepID=UPI002E342965|nr:hypothetical protein [Sphingomonas sp.]HEX4694172.1 hypothetical protein [Sphingomonas sp.]
MKKMLSAVTAAAVIVSVSSPVVAKKKVPAPVAVELPTQPLQPVAAIYPAGVDPASVPQLSAGAVLPSNTEVVVKMTSELSTKKVREGDRFTAATASDVMLGNMIVIPRGTLVNGMVTYRTGKGAFGKSAKMEYALTSLDLNGQSVPLEGHFRQEGNGNTGATVAAAVAVGVFSAFVTGRSAVVPAGTELKAYTRMALPVLPPVSGAAASK